MLIGEQISSREMLDLKIKTKFCFSKISHLKFPLNIFCCFVSSSKVPTIFKSSTYITIIVNPIFNFLIKMHGHIELFTNPYFSK